MLQYAAARALSLERGTTVRPDTYQLDFGIFGTQETRRAYSLSLFPALQKLAKFRYPLVEAIAPFSFLREHVYLSLAKRCFPGARLHCFDGFRTHDVAGFFRLPDRSYLTGYYFSERFFAPWEVEIRRDFAFPLVSDRRNIELLSAIADRISVALHVRRTDYLAAASANLATVCDLDYYHRGIGYFEDLLEGKAHYFVFSDDPVWARNHLPLPPGRFTVVDHNTGDRAIEDMRLMSACDHQLIANSTFSWWGAWLNDHTDKVVVAPKSWYRNYTGPSEDLIVPGGWVRV